MKLAVCLLAVMTMGACSEDDGKDPEAPVKCEDFLQTLCARLDSCFPEDPATAADCVSVLKQDVPCSKALGVSSSYNACMSSVRTLSCAVASSEDFTTPADCRGAILFDQKTLDEIKN